MDDKEIIKNEQTFLRAELQELKRCQLQYFITSVGGTGLIFGMLDKLDGKEIFFLAPLIILIPCWWTFFDKATTITRLVGYYNLLEEQLSVPKPRYYGYERALKMFRQCEDEKNNKTFFQRLLFKIKEIPSTAKDIFKLLFVTTRHRYWLINWCTFFVLTSVCCYLPFKFKNDSTSMTTSNLLLYTSIIITAISAIGTLIIVSHLTNGKYSYKKVADFWKDDVLRYIDEQDGKKKDQNP